MKLSKWLAALIAAFSSVTLFAQEFESERREMAPTLNAPMGGIKVGVTDIEDLGDPVMTFGIFGDTALEDNVLVGASLDYWEKSTGRLTSVQKDVNDLALGVNAKYLFVQALPPLKPYVLAGASAHRIQEKTTRFDNNQRSVNRDIDNNLGIDVGGGVLYRLQDRLDVLGEARYRNLLGETSYDQLAFTGGLTYLM